MTPPLSSPSRDPERRKRTPHPKTAGAELELNSAQRRAVQAPLEPLLIIAGAGTGKTRTLMSRLLHLLESGVNPAHISAITFTNKAANEMADRIANGEWQRANGRLRSDRLLAMSNTPCIGTFHSLGARILRSDPSPLGRSKNFMIVDDDDSMQLIRRILKSRGSDKSKPGPAFCRDIISRVKSGALTLHELQLSGRADQAFAHEIFEAYEQKLEEHDAFDFDDLIGKVVRLFELHPEVLEKYRARFSHILIDEYQDLNNAQYNFVKHMTKHSKSFSAVGDDAQMIYGWRGSNIKIFLNFPNDWPNHRAVFLEENYRSSGNIIAAASAVIAKNAYQPLTWPRKQLWTRNPSGSPVRIIETADEEEEASWIIHEIQKSKIKNKNEGIAVLYRTNAQSRPIEQALLRAEIPYRIFGGLKFYERREVKDVLAGIRYTVNPKDEMSRLRLEKNLIKSAFFGIQEQLQGKQWQTPSELIEAFLEATQYLGHLERNFTNAAERKENIAALLNFSRDFRDILSFLDQIALLQASDDPARRRAQGAARDEHPIELMTIHLAKGLEFDSVFITGAVEGLLPHARSFDSEQELEEERRLMYVAMTRARHELSMSFYDVPSRYLADMPSDTLEFLSLVSDTRRSFDDEERYIALD